MVFMPGNGRTSSLSGYECGSVVESVWWVIELHLNFVVATPPQRQIPPAEDCPGPPGLSGFLWLRPWLCSSVEEGLEKRAVFPVHPPPVASRASWEQWQRLVSVSVPCARDSQLF